MATKAFYLAAPSPSTLLPVTSLRWGQADSASGLALDSTAAIDVRRSCGLFLPRCTSDADCATAQSRATVFEHCIVNDSGSLTRCASSRAKLRWLSRTSWSNQYAACSSAAAGRQEWRVARHRWT
jgi:hypothetical protein